ncbi:MAG: flagellar basal body-associated FliL family protein [Pseudomonadota bacterium]
MGKILPILMVLVGLGGGGAAGYFLRAEPKEEMAEATNHDCPAPEVMAASADPGSAGEKVKETGTEFVDFENQFVVPVTSSDAIVSMVVISLTLEVSGGTREAIFRQMPRLRDSFLDVLFDHSSTGGFSASFVNGSGLNELRDILRETAIGTAGTAVQDVLIADLIQQDL